MSNRGKEATQRLLAIIVIVAMLGVMGIPPSVIVFFAVVTYFIWRAVQHSEHQETGRVFEFYIKANDILRDEERRWYGFEIKDVIDQGETVLNSMADPPPLVYYALGALYHQVGDHDGAAEHLAYIVENADADERHRLAPSPELRRYVQILRKLEREPAEAPQTMAAIRSLDRARRNRAASLLVESREQLKAAPAHGLGAQSHTHPAHQPPQRCVLTNADSGQPAGRLQSKPAGPPAPIAEVLRDLYEEEKKTA